MRTSPTLATSQVELDDYLLDIGDELAKVTSTRIKTNYWHSAYDTSFLRYNLPLFVNLVLVRHCDYSSFYEPELNHHIHKIIELKPSDTIDKGKEGNLHTSVSSKLTWLSSIHTGFTHLPFPFTSTVFASIKASHSPSH
ncbi:hypothetical protein R3P38DRAFT_3202990 [Favolaschia claudopus]|uniref:Uncharacterized protein n=1 Tax=Favolaschia claudopus TaxID=2862362 RepID=A0AAW0AT81_9AGAR